MLGHFIAVTVGAAPAALAVALLHKSTGEDADGLPRSRGARALFVALGAGALAALVVAWLRDRAVLTQSEPVALATLVPLVLAEAAVLVAAWTRFGRTRWAGRAALATAALLACRTLPALFLGLSAQLLPGQSPWSTAFLSRHLGFAAGLGLVALAAWFAAKATSRVGPALTRGALTAAFALLLLGQLTTIVQILHGRRLVDLPRGAFRALVWSVNHQSWVLYGLLLITAGLVAWSLGHVESGLPGQSRPAQGESGLPGQSRPAQRQSDQPAEPRPAQLQSGPPPEPRPALVRLATATRRRRLRLGWSALASLALILLTATLFAALHDRPPALSEPEPFEVVGNQAVIALAQVDDGHLHRFAFETSDGTVVRFIVIKKGGNAYGVGLDACEICGATGYIERAGKIICRLCDVVINIATIGLRGGCNPIPLDHEIDGGRLIVDLAELEKAAPIFA